MTDEPIPSLAEAMANAASTPVFSVGTMDMAMAEIRRLRERILEFEALAAAQRGTLASPTPDEPARFTHDVPPSAPPHNE